ncbi:MAG: EF-hand domain-containing protein [Planctomycetota bacterium]
MKLVPIGLAALSILAFDASAQRGGFGGGNVIEVWEHLAAQYDKNQDGKIVKAEYPRGDQKFANWDSDGDGAITQSDLENRRRGRRAGGRNRGQGGNRGGTRTIMPNNNFILGRHVARPADHDKDSKVTGKEWTAFIARLDCDEDGLVSGEELKLSNRRFRMVRTAMDANQDGNVQLQELAAVFAQLDRDQDKELSGREIGIFGNRAGNRGATRGGSQAGVPQPGDVAPDFELPLAEQPQDAKDAKQKVTIKLSSFAGKKPVALIFGSYT